MNISSMDMQKVINLFNSVDALSISDKYHFCHSVLDDMKKMGSSILCDTEGNLFLKEEELIEKMKYLNKIGGMCKR